MNYNMKYVRFQDLDGVDCIILFPMNMNHNETIKRIRHITLISAGFVSRKLECFGRSESLNLDSKPEEDTKLLEIQFTYGCC